MAGKFAPMVALSCLCFCGLPQTLGAQELFSVLNRQDQSQTGKQQNWDNNIARDTFADVLRSESNEMNRELSEEAIAEIIEIRNRLGGGTGLELDHLLHDRLEKTSDISQQSVNLFGMVAEPTPIDSVIGAEKLFLDMLVAEGNAVTKRERTMEYRSAADRIDAAVCFDTPSIDITSVRSMARRMEDLAADMEELAMYDDADLLRNKAHKIRLQARQAVMSAKRSTGREIR